ncbi:hypothetical protein KY285_032458 [Solanum tuberosum]|nr:hypothetical protein KY285_032458 [Solanum tuberosum]
MAFRPFNRKNYQATLFKARKSPTNGTLSFQQGERPNYSILSLIASQMAYYPSDRMKDQVILSPTIANQWHTVLPIRQKDQTTPHLSRQINIQLHPLLTIGRGVKATIF